METGSVWQGKTKYKDGKLFCVEYSKGMRTGFHVHRATGSMAEVTARLDDKRNAPKKKNRLAEFGKKQYRSRRKRQPKQRSLI